MNLQTPFPDTKVFSIIQIMHKKEKGSIKNKNTSFNYILLLLKKDQITGCDGTHQEHEVGGLRI